MNTLSKKSSSVNRSTPSTGFPTARPIIRPPDQVRAKIVGLAAGTYVKIHTVGFQVAGDVAAQEFLKKIAAATGGKYVQVN